jgi:hypothetical protein
MNPLTPETINQYQWQVADGVARIVNPFENIEYHACEQNSDTIQACTCTKFESIDKINVPTNAPDGIYSGEAFELIWQIQDISGNLTKAYIVNVIEKKGTFEEWAESCKPIPTRLYLHLKPSHLPAVLTTQPGEEWKDRYKPLYEYYNAATDKWAECDETHGHPVYPTSITWHLITPPAEQEAETVDNNGTIEPIIDCGAGARSVALWLESYCNTSLPYHNMVSDAARKAAKHIDHLQSTLAQKDQRIAELEREREWVSVAIKEPELDSTILIADLIMGGVAIMDYDDREQLQYFKYWRPY